MSAACIMKLKDMEDKAMDSINEILPVLNDIIQGIGKHFGATCELVIHDYKNDFEKTIVGIVNGEVTGRQLGDCATSIGLKIYKGETVNDGHYDGVFNYLSQTKTGRLLRSSTIYLRNKNDEIIGSICINNDITDLSQAINAISSSINIGESKKQEAAQKERVFVGKIDDLLKSLMTDSINQIGIPVSQMTKKQKIEGIRILRDQGVFKVQKSADLAAQYYGVSKFTIYNYLNEIESEENACSD